PPTACRLLASLAALHHCPCRPAAVRALVEVAGAAFRGWRWLGGPPPHPHPPPPPPQQQPQPASHRRQRQQVLRGEEQPAAGSVHGGSGGDGSSGGGGGSNSVGGDEGRGAAGGRLSERELRALLQGVAGLPGAYPGEPWLADWCAAYLPHLHCGGSGRGSSRRTAITAAAAARGSFAATEVATAEAEGGTQPCVADAPDSGTAAAEMLYCLATLQFSPPEPWEAAALAAVQRGLRPWLGLLRRLDPPAWAWAAEGPGCEGEGAEGSAEAATMDLVAGRKEEGVSRHAGRRGQRKRPGEGAKAAGRRPGSGTATEDEAEEAQEEAVMPLPPLTLVQLAWAVGAHAAACPLPPPPPYSPPAYPHPPPTPQQQTAPEGVQPPTSSSSSMQQEQQLYGGSSGTATTPTAAERAARRRCMWGCRRRVFGAALAAVAVWGREGSAGAAMQA
ncbi:hypothetical protein Agub_g992, partial [Astrephomene gubernaculifera]